MKSAVTDSASAAELETPDNLAEALDTGFLPDDPHYRLTGEFKDKDKEKPPEKADAPAAPTENPPRPATRVTTKSQRPRKPQRRREEGRPQKPAKAAGPN